MIYRAVILFFLSAVTAFAQGNIRRMDTLAQMCSTDPRSISTGGKLSVQTAGRLTPGDGGGSLYYWDSASTLTTNSGTCFPVKGATGRWLLEYWTGSVRLFGAMADDSTDDTDAIQQAINFASNRVIFPFGTYKITRPLQVTNATVLSTNVSYIHFDIRGQGPGKSIIKCYAPTNILQFANLYAQDGVVADLDFTYNQVYTEETADPINFMADPAGGSTIWHYYNLTFENLTFSRGHYAFNQMPGGSVWGCKFERINVGSDVTGGAVDFHNSPAYGNPNNIFRHWYILGDRMTGPIFYFTAQTVLTVTDMEINRLQDHCQVVNLTSCFNAIFEGLRVEVGRHSQMYEGLFSYGSCFGLTFRNLQFVTLDFTADNYVFLFKDSSGPGINTAVHIDGVEFMGCTAVPGKFAMINSGASQHVFLRKPSADTPNIVDQLVFPYDASPHNVMGHFAQGPPSVAPSIVGQRAQTNLVPLVASAGVYYPDANYSLTQPEAHGAKGDNTADDTAAINKALQLHGGLSLQPKIYRISGPLWVSNTSVADVVIAGNGARLNSSATDQPILIVSNAALRSIVIRDLTAGYVLDYSANTNTDVIVFQGDPGAGVHRPERVLVQSLRTVNANQAVDVRSRWAAMNMELNGINTDATMREAPIDLDNNFLGQDNLIVQNVNGNGINLPSGTPFIRMTGTRNGTIRNVWVDNIRGQLVAGVIGEKLQIQNIGINAGTFTQAGAGVFQLYDIAYPTIENVKLTGVSFNVPASSAFVIYSFGTTVQLDASDINLANTTVTAGTVAIVHSSTGKALLVGDSYTGTTAGILPFNPSGVATNFQRRVVFQADDVPAVGEVLKIGPNGVALWSPP